MLVRPVAARPALYVPLLTGPELKAHRKCESTYFKAGSISTGPKVFVRSVAA